MPALFPLPSAGAAGVLAVCAAADIGPQLSFVTGSWLPDTAGRFSQFAAFASAFFRRWKQQQLLHAGLC